ncbi:MAG: mucoidy inhibitor MuiA family protein, partial [Bacteroidota bacterium]
MKKFSLIILALFIVSAANCQLDTLQPKSKITDVTLFFSGAQITRKVELKLKKGKFLLILDKLPQEINPQSIQVNGIANCKILSVKHQLNYQNENKKGTEEVEIKNTLDAQSFKIKEIKNKLNVFELEEKLLLDNSLLSKKDEGSTVAKIKEAADFYRLRLNEIRKEKLNLLTESEAINKKIQELNVQMNELTSKKRKTYSQILITIDAETALAADLPVTYFISSAGWEPLYDFRVDDIKKPLVIDYNANVFQSTGEDWNNVNIKLSSNNPTISGSKPEIIPWYLGRKSPYQKDAPKKGSSAIKGRVLDVKTNEGLPFANVAIYNGNDVIALAGIHFINALYS